MTPLLEARAVSRTFQVSQGFLAQPRTLHAVSSVSFTLNAGECLGLVGESGCGKSTLGRLACGLLPATNGSIELMGRSLPPAGYGSWAKGKIQIIFQDPVSSLDPRHTAAATIAEPLIAAGEPKKTAMAKANAAMELVGLQDMGKRYPHQFSGGQRQRIAIARALITNPQVIICDEPVSALDASVQAQILNLLKALQAQYNPAYLFISHDLAVVGFICSRIMVMYLGGLVEQAPAHALLDHPAHPYSSALVRSMPQGRRNWTRNEGHIPKPLSGELPSPVNPPSGCYFHPRCVRAREICMQKSPPWQQIEPEWGVKCYFPLI